MISQETAKSICNALQNLEFNEYFIRCKFKYVSPDSTTDMFTTTDLKDKSGYVGEDIFEAIYLEYSTKRIEKYICLIGSFYFLIKGRAWDSIVVRKYVWDTENNQLCTIKEIRMEAPDVCDYMTWQ